MSAPDRIWAGCWAHGGDVARSLQYAERVLLMDDATEYIRLDLHDEIVARACKHGGDAMDALLVAARERDRYRTALEEITCPPQEHPDTGEDYGCLDLHEARHIARAALNPTEAEEATP